ncbi:hypothetical protein F2Q70_00043217 [Brassica cretica]|uniref:Uncharacterized protein n=1 Tax=Brassica cretica TaxID=69181 RepID=A0A8S9KBU8_BRACR|nr:hypothetical protein F2Q70_00043217 [Brassica cretica]
MLRWAHLTAGILSIVILFSLLAVFLRRWCCLRRSEDSTAHNTSSPIRRDSFQARISKLHQTSLSHQLDISDMKRRGSINNSCVSRRATGGLPSKSGLFIWTDHPALVTEAVENGWTGFGFAVHTSTRLVIAASPRPALLGLSTTAGSDDPGVVITWEVSNGSEDFTQKIKFNQVFRETVNGKNPLMLLRAALPLPGPQLICSAFPQEAYFEIILLEIIGRRGVISNVCLASVEGEKTMLFKSQGPKPVTRKKRDGENEEAILSLGLGTGGSVELSEAQLPGKFPASIGFQSDGAVYLDGIRTSIDEATPTNRGGLVPKVISDMSDINNHGEEISADTYATPMRHQFKFECLGDKLQKIENATTTMNDNWRRADKTSPAATDDNIFTSIEIYSGLVYRSNSLH